MLIGIIGAMESEIEIIKNMMKTEKNYNKAKMIFSAGTLLNKEIVLVKSGIGKVNAAICTQILIDDFNVDLIINIGVAGGVSKEVKVGDVVIATDLIQHDVDGSACNYEIGQIPRLDTYSFVCDPKLVEAAFEASKDTKGFNIFKGRIISGDQIISSSDKLIYFREKFNPFAVEMESAAIGHVCYLNNIPLIIIRAISDGADECLIDVYEEYEQAAIENATKVLMRMIKNM